MTAGRASISALIATYNRAGLLREALDSVLAQSRRPDEIIVVNDGSTDETENVIRSYGENITLINKPNGGRASALNIGLPRCKSDYVWLFDDDDLVEVGGLAHLAALLDADDSLDFVCGTYRIFHDEGATRHYGEPVEWLQHGEPSTKLHFLEGMFTSLNAVLARRSCYEKTGPFREELLRSQDYDMAIRLSRHAKAIYTPRLIFSQREHAGQRGPARDTFPAARSVEKWMSYEQKVLSRVRQEFAIEEFTPTFALAWGSPRAGRAALLQRACIFARRALWQEAIDDFRRAIELSPAPATPEEIRLAEAVIKFIPAWRILHARADWVKALHGCTTSSYGRDIIQAACRPLVWHARDALRNHKPRKALENLRILIAVLGLRGCFSRLVSSLLN